MRLVSTGVEAGDGRDESNRSLQERLADAQNSQTTAESEAQQAEIKSKHLAKQLAETQKVLISSSMKSQHIKCEWRGLGTVD